jgi:hypothetical protein
VTTFPLVFGGLLVVGAGLVRGDQGAILALLVVTVGYLVTVLPSLPSRRRRALLPAAEEARTTDFPTYNRLYSAVLLSGTSERHVDLTLRPVLLRVLAAELEDSGPDVVRARLGERWWALVDPARPAGSNSQEGGLDRTSLLDLLDRLEDP